MTQNKLTAAAEGMRMRTGELRWVPLELIDPHPANYRTHPDRQRRAFRGAVSSLGFAGALEVVERGGRYVLTDGHLRREELSRWFKPGDLVPVLTADLDDAEAAEYVATKDYLASLAGVNVQALDELLRSIDTGNADQLETIAELAAANGLDYGDTVGEATFPDLPDGDRPNIRQMTFTVTASQQDVIEAALADAKGAGAFGDTGNENSNGNALARVCEAYANG